MGFSCLSPLTVSVSDIIRGGEWELDVTKYYRRCLVSSDSISYRNMFHVTSVNVYFERLHKVFGDFDNGFGFAHNRFITVNQI